MQRKRNYIKGAKAMTGKKGECVNCKKLETCNKLCGKMFGFCSTDYEPKNKQETKQDEQKD